MLISTEELKDKLHKEINRISEELRDPEVHWSNKQKLFDRRMAFYEVLTFLRKTRKD